MLPDSKQLGERWLSAPAFRVLDATVAISPAPHLQGTLTLTHGRFHHYLGVPSHEQYGK
jgi:hypothetical protein